MNKTCRSINWLFSLQSHKQGGLALAEIQQELGTLSKALPFGSPVLVSPAAWDGGLSIFCREDQCSRTITTGGCEVLDSSPAVCAIAMNLI